jgi:hypothetical protein
MSPLEQAAVLFIPELFRLRRNRAVFSGGKVLPLLLLRRRRRQQHSTPSRKFYRPN